MTVLFLTRLFYPHIGGVEKHVIEISKRLVARGHKVIVVTEYSSTVIARIPTKSGDEAISINREKEVIHGINIYRINGGKEGRLKKFRIWKRLWKLRKLIKESNIVHCHDVFFWYLPFRFLYPRKPVFTTFHGYESYPVSRGAIIIRKISEKLSLGNICIGDFIKKWYGTKPDYVSYGAVDIPHLSLRGEHDNARRSNLSQPSALFIGRLDDQTGIQTYNEVFKALRKKYPEFKFLIVGDGPCKNSIDKRAKAVGFQKNPEKYFQDHHFAFVSRYLSILEAMAAKRLVFAVYDNPVKEDYLKMAPFAKFIIIENNARSLAYQVEKIINNPDIEQEMIKKAYEWVKKQTWEEMVKTYTKLWNK